MRDFGGKQSTTSNREQQAAAPGPAPGRRALTDMLLPLAPAPVQLKAATSAPVPVMPSGPRPTLQDLFGKAQCKAVNAESDTAAVHASAQRGIATAASPLPYAERIQQLFGRHDISGGQAHTGPRPSSVPGRGTVPEQHGTQSDGQVHAVAAQAIGGGGGALPFLDQIQRAFGRHDIRSIVAHAGGEATAAAHAIGADAFAMGDHVAFSRTPDLRTAAHEAAHVIQQRAGIPIAVGAAGDAHEQHADRVADLVASGQSAEAELDGYSSAGMPGGGSIAVQRHVEPDLNVGDRVSIITLGNAPGAVVQHHPDDGYDVQYASGKQSFKQRFTYSELDPRNPGAWVDQPVTSFQNIDGQVREWAIADEFPYDFGTALAGKRKLIVCAPSARGDMHDIRAALMMDANLQVIVAFHDNGSLLAEDWRTDVRTIVGYYQGIPNFQQRVATMKQNAEKVREHFNAISASDSTSILHKMQNQYDQRDFDEALTYATTGLYNADDEFDCVRALMAASFNRTASYVLVNIRDSGHNPGNRPPSHPEHDSGAQGFWDMVRAVVLAGHVPVPMGAMDAMPGLANWPGASLLNYFNWPACQANSRRNKRQAEYYLLAALKRFNPYVYALAWRSGVTDAISFAGIPVIALDVDKSKGHERAKGREDLLGGDEYGNNHYTQLDMSNRVAAEGYDGPRLGVAGWLGPLTKGDITKIVKKLGAGPVQPLITNLRHKPQPQPRTQPQESGPPEPPPPEQARRVVRRFAKQLQRLASFPGQALALAARGLTDQQRQELVTAVAHARMAAMWDLVDYMHDYVKQAPETAPPQDGNATTGVVQVGVVGDWLVHGANGHGPVLQRDVHNVLDQLEVLWRTLREQVTAVLVQQQMLAQQPAQQLFAQQGNHGNQDNQDMYDPFNPTE